MKIRINAGMGELKVSDDPNVMLTALGLGSCVGVILYEPARQIAAILHIVLPRAHRPDDEKPFRFADLAIPRAIELLSTLGASPSRLRAAIAGGAAMFSFGTGSHINIGENNVEAVRCHLATARVPVIVDDTGGDVSRTLIFDVETADVSIKRAGGEETVMGNLAVLYWSPRNLPRKLQAAETRAAA